VQQEDSKLMLVGILEASEANGIAFPGRTLGYFFLFLYLFLLAFFFYRHHKQLKNSITTQWKWIISLALAGFITAQLAPLRIPLSDQPVTLFSLFPLFLAASFLHPAAVLLIGLTTGLGEAYSQTHHLLTSFDFAFVGYFAAQLMQQRYQGRPFHWLRHPIVAGTLSVILASALNGMTQYVSTNALGQLAALDQALYSANITFWVYLIEGLIGSLLVIVTHKGIPFLQTPKKLIPSPTQRSLRGRLLGNFLAFSMVLTALVLAIVFNLSIDVSRRFILNQMAHNATVAYAEIPEFQQELKDLVDTYDITSLINDNPEDTTNHLEEIYKRTGTFREIIVVNDDLDIIATYPPTNAVQSLLEGEANGLQENENTDQAFMGSSGKDLSFIVPITDSNNEPKGAIIGRVAPLSLYKLIASLQGSADEGVGFIVNEAGIIIAHPVEEQLTGQWEPDENGRFFRTPSETKLNGAYQSVRTDTNTRELVYYLRETAQPWTVVLTVPYAVVLDLALNIGTPLFFVLLLVTMAFTAHLAYQSRGISQPITEIVQASKTMAAGENWIPTIHPQREDEIGQLGKAFSLMQRSMKKRLNELSLLLAVSQNVSTNIDLKQGMPAILRGALRGTGASGARAIVLNPSGGNPLTFGEGPASDIMVSLDRRLMTKLRYSPELILATPDDIRAALEFDETTHIPIPSLLAIPLHSHDRFQGIVWLGYRIPGSFDLSERNLLHTLASQAAVLVENARLFATAEGGRRRLAAVLASTSDAVIVTDPTDRVLLINPAMEHLFDLKAADSANRPVSKIITSKALVEALTNEGDYTHNLEVPVIDGRIFYASISRIKNREGQIFGRVCVLRDITHLKEIDKMKSEFVSTVSHDLRNPLTFMRGYISMLPMVGEINEKQNEYVEKIMNGIDQMSKMVDDLLDLSRIEAGMDFNQDEIALQPLLNDIAEQYWQHAHLAGIKLEVEVLPKNAKIRGDEQLIRQAITNLVGNGIKYAQDSGLMMLRAAKKNSKVIISVKDNGPGIPEENQIRLFEKFYRVKSPGTERIKGTGLGLAIVKTIAERHGGTARCHSKPGEGATFFIELPNRPYTNGSTLMNGQNRNL
jgi:PAS domain S-box-containing protein